MSIEEWEELMGSITLSRDRAIRASEICSEKIEVTTLSDPEPIYIKAGPLCYIATCIIITDRNTHSSHNYCIYGRVPLDSLPEFKGLQKLLESEAVTHLADKGVFIHIMCLTLFSKERLFQVSEDWFRNKSQSEEIDYREIIS